MHYGNTKKKLNEEEVEKVMSIGPYIEGVFRPIKQTKDAEATEDILARTSKLKDIEEYKDIFIKKSMNEDETKILRYAFYGD